MNKTETARHVMGGNTRGKTGFLQAPGWITEIEIYIPWRIYAAQDDKMIQNESSEKLFPSDSEK